MSLRTLQTKFIKQQRHLTSQGLDQDICIIIFTQSSKTVINLGSSGIPKASYNPELKKTQSSKTVHLCFYKMN